MTASLDLQILATKIAKMYEEEKNRARKEKTLHNLERELELSKRLLKKIKDGKAIDGDKEKAVKKKIKKLKESIQKKKDNL